MALGEQTHGDGKTFELRARVIEYLMSEMDFDVVLFEAGMFDLYHGNELMQNSNQVSDGTKGLFWFWRDAVQHEDLFDYWQGRMDAGLP